MTWTIQNGRKLEITAGKASEGLVWKRLLRDDAGSDGEEINHPDAVEDCLQQMTHLTIEKVKQILFKGTGPGFHSRASLSRPQVVTSQATRSTISKSWKNATTRPSRNFSFTQQTASEKWAQRLT